MSRIIESDAGLLHSLGIYEATVVEVLKGGAVEVRLSTQLRTIVCHCLDTGRGFPLARTGDTVVCLLSSESASRGYLFGIVQEEDGMLRTEETPKTEKLIPSRLVLEAKEEVVIKTTHSKIAIRANGDVEVFGRRIVSRATKSQKLLAPMLKLN